MKAVIAVLNAGNCPDKYSFKTKPDLEIMPKYGHAIVEKENPYR